VGVSALLSFALCGAALAACGKSDPKSPGVEGMGAPGTAWSEKTDAQKLGFMAAVVHPRMEKLFSDHDSSYKGSFTCETCHGENAEMIDYAMPPESLYALPKDNPIEESMEYDADVTKFMQESVVPELGKMLDQGEGPRTKVDCFSCHPTED
jgi:hypothetical protein